MNRREGSLDWLRRVLKRNEADYRALPRCIRESDLSYKEGPIE